MDDISCKGGSTTCDDEIMLENDCFKFLKNHSNLFSKLKKFEKIIIDLKKKICEKDNENRNQKSSFLNKIDQISGQLIDSEIIRKDLEIQINILKDELKEIKKLPKEEDEPKEETCTNAFQHFCMNKKRFCHECQDFGHIASECANTLDKAKNKGSNVTWDDSDKINFTSFVTTFKDDCDIFTNDSDCEFTDDEIYDYEGNSELSYEEKFRELLNDFCVKRKENSKFSYKINDLEKEINFLKKCLGESDKKLEIQKIDFEDELKISQNKLLSSEKNLNLQRAEFLEKLKNSQIKFLSCEKARKELERKNSILSSKLENYKNISHQFTNGSQGLDKLLNIGKSFKDRSGLGFDKASNVPSTSQTTFVKASKRVETSKVPKEKSVSKDSSCQNPRPNVHERNKDKFSSPRTTSKKFIPICHHCGIIGHIRPKCFKLLNTFSSPKNNFEKSKINVKKSHISNKNFNSNETFLSNSKFKTFDNNRNTSYSCTSHNKYIPTCHHCGVVGHIRPKCYKFLNEKSSFEMNFSNKFDVLMCEIARLRKGKDRRPTIDLFDSKRNCGKNVWVKKNVLKNISSPKVFDFSKIKILKRPGDGLN